MLWGEPQTVRRTRRSIRLLGRQACPTIAGHAVASLSMPRDYVPHGEALHGASLQGERCPIPRRVVTPRGRVRHYGFVYGMGQRESSRRGEV